MNTCEACRDQPIPGILTHTFGKAQESFERCDTCKLFRSDDAAREWLVTTAANRRPADKSTHVVTYVVVIDDAASQGDAADTAAHLIGTHKIEHATINVIRGDD